MLEEILPLIPRNTPRMEIELILQEWYETTYKIKNHKAPDIRQEPMALVAFKNVNNAVDGSVFDIYLDKYTIFNIRKIFGLSLKEYMEADYAFVEAINAKALEIIKAENKAAKEVRGELGIE